MVPVTVQSSRSCLSSLCTAHPLSTSVSAHLPCLCCDFYFIGLCSINGLVLLHLCVSEELQCLVGCTVEWAVATDRTEFGEALEAVPQVGQGQMFLRNLISSVNPLSAEPRRSLGSAGSSRSAARSCWTSLWCKQQLLCSSEGGRQLHVREVWPISIMLHCHFPQKYSPAVAPATCQKKSSFSSFRQEWM